MPKKILFLWVPITILMLALPAPAYTQGRTTIVWFVGLGTGTNLEQVEAENQVVDAFNSSQDTIELVLNVVDYQTATDTLSILIASGQSPDIVGPISTTTAQMFSGYWLDLQPLVDATGYNLDAFDPALVYLYLTYGDLYGIPFVAYPSVLYYNRDLFDKAGLNYPPSKFGDPYVTPDGRQVEWNYYTLAEIARILTADANGEPGGDVSIISGFRPPRPPPPPPPKFDPDNVAQYGMAFQWPTLLSIWANLQPETVYDDGYVSIPESWRYATEWLYDALWLYHFMPGDDVTNDSFGSNALASGQVAMAVVPTWYNCCLTQPAGNFGWDMAVVPRGFDGQYHAAADADTFYITQDTNHPQEAFTVLSYLLDEAVPTLAQAYGALPARSEYQYTWVENESKRYSGDINWQVAIDSLAYSTTYTSLTSALPGWPRINAHLENFRAMLFSEGGADIDLNMELDKLEEELNYILDESR